MSDLLLLGFRDRDDPRYAVIGRIALLHAQLEVVFKMVVKTMEGMTVEEGMGITADMDITDVRERIKALVAEKARDKPHLAAAIKILRRRVTEAAEERNTYLHSMWGWTEDGQLRQYIRARETRAFTTREPPSLAECEAFEEKLRSFVLELNHERLHGCIAEVAGGPSQVPQHVFVSTVSDTPDEGRSLSAVTGPLKLTPLPENGD